MTMVLVAYTPTSKLNLQKENKMEVILANKVVILTFALAFSEVLALIPAVKANSIFQLVVGVVKKIAGK